MNKLTYTSPVVEITAWDKTDVITTSGMTVITTVTPQIGDSNVTARVSYDDVCLK